MKKQAEITPDIKAKILKEAKKRYTYMTVTAIYDAGDKYVVEYVKSLGGKEYTVTLHKDIIH